MATGLVELVEMYEESCLDMKITYEDCTVLAKLQLTVLTLQAGTVCPIVVLLHRYDDIGHMVYNSNYNNVKNK